MLLPAPPCSLRQPRTKHDNRTRFLYASRPKAQISAHSVHVSHSPTQQSTDPYNNLNVATRLNTILKAPIEDHARRCGRQPSRREACGLARPFRSPVSSRVAPLIGQRSGSSAEFVTKVNHTEPDRGHTGAQAHLDVAKLTVEAVEHTCVQHVAQQRVTPTKQNCPTLASFC